MTKSKHSNTQSADAAYSAFCARKYSYFETLVHAIQYPNTILPKLIPILLILGVWSTVIATLFINYQITSVTLSDKPITLFSTVIAILLGFRTNRAFERYWLGAQTWTTLTTQIRNLSRLVWNGINAPADEKIGAIRLLLAIAIANKYSLRGFNAYFYKEVRDLLPSGKFGTGLASIDAMHKIGRVHSNIDRINESFFTGDRRKFGENLGEIFPDSEYNTDDEESPVVIASRTVVVNAPLEIAYQQTRLIKMTFQQ